MSSFFYFQKGEIIIKKIKNLPGNHQVLEIIVVDDNKQFKITRNTNSGEYSLFAVLQEDSSYACISKGKSPLVLEEIANNFDWSNL